MTETEKASKTCAGQNAITPCGRNAEPGGVQCTEHRREIDEFERAYDL